MPPYVCYDVNTSDHFDHSHYPPDFVIVFFYLWFIHAIVVLCIATNRDMEISSRDMEISRLALKVMAQFYHQTMISIPYTILLLLLMSM